MARANAVILLSGGVDSATAAAIAKQQGFDLHALSFRYGQRHERELASAQQVAAFLQAKTHQILSFDLRAIGGSALTDDIAVPKGRSEAEMGKGIPVTYVPARNTIFLSFALALAERIEAQDIFFGANQLDYSGYPDCREEYIQAFERMANLATKAGVEGKSRLTIHTPLLKLSKAAIIKTGLALGLDYALTWSCYDPRSDDRACGRCDSCQLRLKGFAEAGRLIGPDILRRSVANAVMLPNPFTPKFLTQLETLRLRTRKEVLGSQTGSYASPRRGTSLEFADYRRYAPGDDLRYLDWGIYARTDRLYVKVFREEVDLFAYVFIDASASMGFPSLASQIFARVSRRPGAVLRHPGQPRSRQAALVAGWRRARSVAVFSRPAPHDGLCQFRHLGNSRRRPRFRAGVGRLSQKNAAARQSDLDLGFLDARRGISERAQSAAGF